MKLFLLFLSQVAFGTWYGTAYRYSVCCYFEELFEGKSVKAVYVHLGALEKVSTPDGKITWPWYDVKHVALEKKGHSFSLVTSVTGVIGGGTGSEHVESQGPIVQYWIYFNDGSIKITTPELINLVENPQPFIDRTFYLTSQTKPYGKNPYPEIPRLCLKSDE